MATGIRSVLIAGGGLFGLTAALELRRRGLAVTVVDPAPVPREDGASVDISKAVRLDYGRDEELEADMLGMRYMARAGYNPVGQKLVMETLKRASGGSSQPEWLSTHPASDTRISRINDLLRTEYAYTQNSDEYVMKESVYQTRMLDRLARLGPPNHGSGSVSLLDTPVLWCAHCQAEALELAQNDTESE